MNEITLDIDSTTTLPVDLDQLKSDLRISDNALDALLVNQYIPDAMSWAEGVMRRSIIARPHRWILAAFPYGSDTIVLPRGKVQSVTSIVYSSEGSPVTLRGPSSGSPVGTDYQEDLRGHAARIMPNRGATWPSADIDVPAPVVVTFNAGWLTAADVPADIKRGLTARIMDDLDIPGADSFNSQNRDIEFAEKLISAWRILS